MQDERGEKVIPNLVVKSQFSFLARAGGLRPCSPGLEPAGIS